MAWGSVLAETGGDSCGVNGRYSAKVPRRYNRHFLQPLPCLIATMLMLRMRSLCTCVATGGSYDLPKNYQQLSSPFSGITTWAILFTTQLTIIFSLQLDAALLLIGTCWISCILHCGASPATALPRGDHNLGPHSYSNFFLLGVLVRVRVLLQWDIKHIMKQTIIIMAWYVTARLS